MIKEVINGFTQFISGWFDNKNALRKAELKYQIKALSAESDYDMEAQRNMRHTWKDEYLIILHTFPIWGYIIPSAELTKRLDLLWIKLGSAPEWWWGIYVGIVISTFGLRFMFKKGLLNGKLTKE